MLRKFKAYLWLWQQVVFAGLRRFRCMLLWDIHELHGDSSWKWWLQRFQMEFQGSLESCSLSWAVSPTRFKVQEIFKTPQPTSPQLKGERCYGTDRALSDYLMSLTRCFYSGSNLEGSCSVNRNPTNPNHLFFLVGSMKQPLCNGRVCFKEAVLQKRKNSHVLGGLLGDVTFNHNRKCDDTAAKSHSVPFGTRETAPRFLLWAVKLNLLFRVWVFSQNCTIYLADVDLIWQKLDKNKFSLLQVLRFYPESPANPIGAHGAIWKGFHTLILSKDFVT